jgi:hypothetical protein
VEREIGPARVFFNGREPYLLSAVWTVGVDWEEHAASFRLSEWGSYEAESSNNVGTPTLYQIGVLLPAAGADRGCCSSMT